MKPIKFVLVSCVFSLASMAQAPQQPNLEKQRTAMSKLQFLVGSWSGAGRMWRSTSQFIDFTQTEQAAYKLDGLLLTVEGAGTNKSDNTLVLQAFGLISYDDQAGVYRFRAFNDGRWLESEVQLDEASKSLQWGFTVGGIKVHSTLRINQEGDWTETHEVTLGSEPARKFMELTVKRQK